MGRARREWRLSKRAFLLCELSVGSWMLMNARDPTEASWACCGLKYLTVMPCRRNRIAPIHSRRGWEGNRKYFL
jgi:hypothetical protein